MIYACKICGYKTKGISSIELGFVQTRIRHKFVCEECAREIAHNVVDGD